MELVSLRPWGGMVRGERWADKNDDPLYYKAEEWITVKSVLSGFRSLSYWLCDFRQVPSPLCLGCLLCKAENGIAFISLEFSLCNQYLLSPYPVLDTVPGPGDDRTV